MRPFECLAPFVCCAAMQTLRYDLGDCALWEYMFPSNDKPQLLMPADEDDEQEQEVCLVALPVRSTC